MEWIAVGIMVVSAIVIVCIYIRLVQVDEARFQERLKKLQDENKADHDSAQRDKKRRLK